VQTCALPISWECVTACNKITVCILSDLPLQVERSYATVGRRLSHLYQLIPTKGFGPVKPGLVGLSNRCNVKDACGMAASRRAQRTISRREPTCRFWIDTDMAVGGSFDTFPKLLARNAAQFSSRPAVRH